MSDRRPTLQEAINLAVSVGMRNLYTCIPARVTKWDASKQRADCKILIKEPFETEEGEREVQSWPIVTGVLTQFLGAGGFRITCPVSDGTDGQAATIGTLMFAHRSLDKWSTGNGNEVDPEFDHDHSLSDAIFIPGLMPFGGAWGDVPTDGMSVGKDSGLQVKITGSLITLAETSANAQFVALANKVKAWFDAFNTAVTGWTPVPNDGGAALKTALSTLTGGTPTTNVAASKVKAE